jgi:hypothetical protein
MSTEWQPLTWILFHTIALNYNNNYKDKYIEFFETFKTILPCSICKNHYTSNVNSNELSIINNINEEKIFNWTIDLHNIINKQHHKKQWTYENALNYYKNNNFNNKVLKIFLFEYIRANFKKNYMKTTELIKMIKTLPYFIPDENKRNLLIDFNNKFELTKKNLRQWIIAFLIILKK